MRTEEYHAKQSKLIFLCSFGSLAVVRLSWLLSMCPATEKFVPEAATAISWRQQKCHDVSGTFPKRAKPKQILCWLSLASFPRQSLALHQTSIKQRGYLVLFKMP